MKHFVIPDTQVRPGVKTDHLVAAANYACEKEPDVIIFLGDHWDMPSLNRWEKKGSAYFEGRRYQDDIESANDAMESFWTPIRRKRNYSPKKIFLKGNHEDRVRRAAQEEPKLKGTIDESDFHLADFDVVRDFLYPLKLHGVLYSHYFINPDSAIKGQLGGQMQNRLRAIGQSFTQGHLQGRMFGSRFTVTGEEHLGLVVGSFYSHREDYMGLQGDHYWRGCVMKHEVRAGHYDPMFLSLKYLVRNWL